MKSKGSWLCAILIALFFLGTNLHIASRRLLWYDEIGTIRRLQAPDLPSLWRLQNSWRGDSAPTFYMLLADLFYQSSGRSDLAVRVLSALAMSATLLVVFDCTRRLTDGVYGLIAVCFLSTSFLTHYGYEGRSYALVVLFTSVALWLWLHTKRESTAAAVAFGVAIFLDLGVHFNSVLALVPFGVWELYRWRQDKGLSPKIVAGVAGMLCGIASSVQQIVMMHSIGLSPASWAAPTLRALVNILGEIFPIGLFVLGALILLVCLVGAAARPMTDAERLCWFFLTIPLAGYVLAVVATNSFYNRYLIAILPGVAVAFACLVSRYLNKPASVAFLLLLAALTLGRQVGQARHPELIEPPSAGKQHSHTREALAVEDALVSDGKTTIITEFGLTETTRYYSKRPNLYAMYGPDEDPYYCKFASACRQLDEVKAHAREVAAIYPSDKLVTDLTQAGLLATVRMTEPYVVYFSPR